MNAFGDANITKRHITNKHFPEGLTVFEVNSRKCTYRGHTLESLGNYGKRKFENHLILSNPRERIKVIFA